MRAIVTKALGDMRHRRVQAAIIAFVVALSCCAGTLALSLLTETDAPFDHAFASQQGAHVTMFYDVSRVTSSQVARTAAAPAVIASAGPWRQVSTTLDHAGAVLGGAVLTGRTDPYGAVDRLDIVSGRWLRGPGEVVLERHVASDDSIQVGDTLTAVAAAGQPALRVVGIAVSIEREQGWVSPAQVDQLAPSARAGASSDKTPGLPNLPIQLVMDYRLRSATTYSDVLSGEAQISRMLPVGAVTGEGNWLDIKQSADLLSNVMVPFLLAFSAMALLAAALIIASVVTGIVIASYREIGIMKSIGFTPAQIRAMLVGETLVPAALGCAVGLPIGIIVSQPFLQDTAFALGIPLPFTWSSTIVAGVVGGVLLVAAVSAVVPAHRASRLAAVQAITLGSAPRFSSISSRSGVLSRLPLPRALTLGAADCLSRPLRSGITLFAIVVGVATVTFAAGLHGSLSDVREATTRVAAVPVEVSALPSYGPTSTDPSLGVEHILRQEPGTTNVVAVAEASVRAPGAARPMLVRAFRGRSSDLGYALISGHWFSGPGEVVVQSAFLDDSGHRIGDSLQVYALGGRQVLRIVGSYVDNRGGGYTFLADWSTLMQLVPSVSPSWWEVQIAPRMNVDTYVNDVSSPLQSAGYLADSRGGRGIDESFLLLNIVILALAAVLTMIAVAGVFNTVLLNTRENLRGIAILKAIGMSPAGVVLMVVTTVALLGVVGGVVGIPVGLLTHHAILTEMGHIAGTALPASFYQALGAAWLPLLAISGLVVAILGALLPATWAARTQVSEVLHSE